MDRRHHDLQHRIHQVPNFFGVQSLNQISGTFNVSKQNRHLLAFAFYEMARGEYLFCQMLRKVTL